MTRMKTPDSGGTAPKQVDENSFTRQQWEAIAHYVEARKRRRKFYLTAGAAALVSCSAALMSRAMTEGSTLDIPPILQWAQMILPIVLLVVLSLGTIAFNSAVASGRKEMLSAGLGKKFVADFEKYPTRKFPRKQA